MKQLIVLLAIFFCANYCHAQTNLKVFNSKDYTPFPIPNYEFTFKTDTVKVIMLVSDTFSVAHSVSWLIGYEIITIPKNIFWIGATNDYHINEKPQYFDLGMNPLKDVIVWQAVSLDASKSDLLFLTTP